MFIKCLSSDSHLVVYINTAKIHFFSIVPEKNCDKVVYTYRVLLYNKYCDEYYAKVDMKAEVGRENTTTSLEEAERNLTKLIEKVNKTNRQPYEKCVR